MTPTLSAALIGHDTMAKKVLMVLGGSLFFALAARVVVPMFPVPMTLQTLAILIVGLTFGARMGAATLLAYLAEGAMGLPVFAGGQAGLAYMMGPTGGFLLGFVLMAWLAVQLAVGDREGKVSGSGALRQLAGSDLGRPCRVQRIVAILAAAVIGVTGCVTLRLNLISR